MADPSKEKIPEEETAPPPPKGKKGNKKLLILGIVLLLIGAAASVILFAPEYLPAGIPLVGKGKPEAAKEAPPKVHGRIYGLDPFIVNLADTEFSRYLKIRIEIESIDAKENEETGKRLPLLRDAILTILSGKTYREIYDSDGKKKLKDEILQRANGLWAGFKFKTVYFTEFVIQ